MRITREVAQSWQFELHVPHGSADGQWQVVDADNVVAIVDPNGAIAEPEDVSRLIAAAPELLEALKAVMSGQLCGKPDLDAPRFQAARAAIAKAEGRD